MGKIMYGEVASTGGLQGVVTVQDAYFVLNHGVGKNSGRPYAFTSFVLEMENEDGEDKSLNFSYLPLTTKDGRPVVGPSLDGVKPAGDADKPLTFGETRDVKYPHIASFDGEDRGVMATTEFGCFIASLVNAGFDMELLEDGVGGLKGAQLELISTDFKSGNQVKKISKVDRFLGIEGKGKKKQKESATDVEDFKQELFDAGIEMLAAEPKSARELSVALYVGNILKNAGLSAADKTKLKAWVASSADTWDGVVKGDDGKLTIG